MKLYRRLLSFIDQYHFRSKQYSWRFKLANLIMRNNLFLKLNYMDRRLSLLESLAGKDCDIHYFNHTRGVFMSIASNSRRDIDNLYIME